MRSVAHADAFLIPFPNFHVFIARVCRIIAEDATTLNFKSSIHPIFGEFQGGIPVDEVE